MTLRVLYALSGLVLAYGAAHGLSPYNLVFDVGIAMLMLAAVVGWTVDHSLRAAWPALLAVCGFFAVLGLQTVGLPDCPSFVELTRQVTATFENATSGGTACLADPNSRPNAWLALVGLGVGLVLGALDMRRSQVSQARALRRTTTNARERGAASDA